MNILIPIGAAVGTFVFLYVWGFLCFRAGRRSGEQKENLRVLKGILEHVVPGTEKLVRKNDPNLVPNLGDPRHPFEVLGVMHEINGRQAVLMEVLEVVGCGDLTELKKSRSEGDRGLKEMTEKMKHLSIKHK